MESSAPISSLYTVKSHPELYYSASVDTGGYGVVWNDDIDIACDELFFNGETVPTPFDGLIAFSDATLIWGLNESTLRKAIAYGKLINGQDVCKFGNLHDFMDGIIVDVS